ncbi:MAG: hypothetical protein QXD10_07595 [Metallosphaera sp.]|uniref:hypothetical protein n=1 Tax=Metallosphaera sp. TaxID=2020860 RepID=UPI0031608FE2
MKSTLIQMMIRFGGNPRCLAEVTGEPSTKVSRTILELQNQYNLTLFPAVYSEGLGLRKYLLTIKGAHIKYETASKLFHPIMNLFRGDIQDQLFSIILFADEKVMKEVDNVLKKISGSNFFISQIKRTRKFVRDPQCYDFESKRWKCEDREELKQGSTLDGPDENDIKGVATIQVNPFFDLRLIPHRHHVLKVITGFMYTLGNLDFIVQVISKDDLSEEFPDVLWTAEGEDIFVSEMHVDRIRLESVLKKLKNRSMEIILSTKSPLYALGYSIPYEIFRKGMWTYPKIEVTVKK